ncbi:unnamed protein product [Rotaria sp. Silwood2]|nr:unnamed protein product [Rotaria sp. Silwood2]CAF3186065.1 unnamed protein product [Rotaria sp. Silwood2]CAF4306455.1 unnamed protein product [Rotaria sp. Silwood2]CAF4347729.1 unnamed protein product [Rotaria sp. Silwood2]CAF4462772.1 unnamed protein product [Rotaria sp. Silwood2]
MLYYVLFATVAILTTVLNGESTTSLKNEPERCCIPTQFSSQLSTSTGMVLPDGTTFTSYAYYNFSYDSNRGMVGMKGVSFSAPDQQKSNVWIIENVNDGQIYTIDEDAKKCYKSTMPIKPIHCIPDTATYVHSFTYGYGDRKIIGDTWRIQKDEAVDYVTVSRDGRCILLTDYTFFQNPVLVDSATITDFVPQIDDPSIFDIPSECKNAV